MNKQLYLYVKERAFFPYTSHTSERKPSLLCAGRISSSCALCDTYKPIKAKCAVFEQAGEVKSCVSLMPNCSH